MLLMGVIALFQVILLPGLIISILLGIRGVILTTLLSFALSLLVNYQLVFVLTLAGFYTENAMLMVIIFECFILIWLYFQRFRHKYISIKLPKFSVGFSSYIILLFAAMAMFSCWTLFELLLQRNPGIFEISDAVVSWNRWAVDWYNNRLPVLTWEYPQLIPANWSITYILTTPQMSPVQVQFFAKAVMGLFPLGILLIFVDIFLRFRSLAALAAISVYAYLLTQLLGNYIGSGYVDIPVAFFMSLAAYLLLLFYKAALNFKAAFFAAGAVAAGAVLTKQAGFFIVFFYFGVLAWLFLFSARQTAYKIRQAWFILLLICLLIVPWYMLKGIQIAQKVDESNIHYLISDIHVEKVPLQRLWIATTNKLPQALHINLQAPTDMLGRISILIGMVFFLLWAFISQTGRLIILAIILPYYLLWATFFSYDIRNIAPVIPFFAMAVGEGLQVFLAYFTRLIKQIASVHPEKPVKIPKLKLWTPKLWTPNNGHLGVQSFSFGGASGWTLAKLIQKLNVFSQKPIIFSVNKLIQSFLVLIVISVIAGLITNNYFSTQLLEKTVILQKQSGNPRINQKLYEYQKVHKFNGKVLTTYTPMYFLPELKPFFYQYHSQARNQKRNLDALVAFRKGLPLSEILQMIPLHHEIQYFLMPDVVFPEVFQQAVNDGSLNVIFQLDGLSLYKLNCCKATIP
jgi:hypothetical protein